MSGNVLLSRCLYFRKAVRHMHRQFKKQRCVTTAKLGIKKHRNCIYSHPFFNKGASVQFTGKRKEEIVGVGRDGGVCGGGTGTGEGNQLCLGQSDKLHKGWNSNAGSWKTNRSLPEKRSRLNKKLVHLQSHTPLKYMVC